MLLLSDKTTVTIKTVSLSPNKSMPVVKTIFLPPDKITVIVDTVLLLPDKNHCNCKNTPFVGYQELDFLEKGPFAG